MSPKSTCGILSLVKVVLSSDLTIGVDDVARVDSEDLAFFSAVAGSRSMAEAAERRKRMIGRREQRELIYVARPVGVE